MSEWIKCSDRMPPAGESVLWYHKKTSKNPELYRVGNYIAPRPATHWMPLPPTPTQEQSK